MSGIHNALKDLVISNLYTQYSGVLSLSNNATVFLDIDGLILSKLVPSPDFCVYVCRQDETHACSDCISHITDNETGRFTCRYGIENTLEPIVVNGRTAGYVLGIQAFSKDMEYQKYLLDSVAIAQERGLDELFVAKALAGVRTLEEKQIETHQQLCTYIAKNTALTLMENTNKDGSNIAKLSIEKEVLEKKIIDLEVKNLSLVINPHFLFNTLNTIARIAYFEGSTDTEELIYCLSDLLRYNIKQENQLHTVESEIDNVKKYLYIQKMRFKNRLTYSINVPEALMNYRIPNMILQPLVENAVLHGITPKRDGGKVTITAEKYKDLMYINVIDDGHGFPPEVLENIYNHESKMGLGFRSTDGRLKRYFGESYGIKIAKSDYSGSTVQISIPVQSIVR